MRSKRLSKSDWINAGISALIEHGPTALKAEPMSRRLNTTKGSFYWHFQDVPDFHRQIIKQWEVKALEQFITAVEGDKPTQDALYALAADRDDELSQTEAAIRIWARSDRDIANHVAEMDARRMSYIRALLLQLDIRDRAVSRLIYGAMIGLDDLAARDKETGAAALEFLFDTILTIR